MAFVVEGQGVVLEGDLEVVLVDGLQLVQGALGAVAVRALELGELDERDLGLFATLDRSVADLDLVDLVADGRLGSGLRSLRRAEALGLAGHEGGVELTGAHALLHQLLGADDFIVHRALELLVGDRATNRTAVDEEVRGALHAQVLGQGQIGIHGRLEGVRIQGRLELVHVQADFLGVLVEGGAIQVGLVGKQGVVHLPELALGGCGQSRLGSQRSLVVEGQRVLAEVDANLIGVFFNQSL